MNTDKPLGNPQIQSFLESLRGRGVGQATPSEFSSFESPFQQYQERQRLDQQRREQFFRARTQTINEVYSSKKREEKTRVSELLQNLRQLASSVQKPEKSVEVAIERATRMVSGGYQVSVIEHLIVRLLDKRRIEDTSTWRDHFNTRRGKQGYYWEMAASKGTKFTLSQERQLATSVG